MLKRFLDIKIKKKNKDQARKYCFNDCQVIQSGSSAGLQNKHEPEKQYVTRKNYIGFRGKKVKVIQIISLSQREKQKEATLREKTSIFV